MLDKPRTKWSVPIKRVFDELVKGDLVYHNHELLIMTSRGRWVKGTCTQKFRRIGRVNLDKKLVGGGE